MAETSLPITAMLGEGRYWFSALEILTTPPGVSFYRSFDHRPEWVSEEVMADISEGGAKTFARGLVGLRCFPRLPDRSPDPDQSAVSDLLIPLRWINSATINRSGNFATAMVLGPYVPMDQGADDLPHMRIPAAQNLKNGDPILLRYATAAERSVISGLGETNTPDSRLWHFLAVSGLLSDQSRERFEGQVVPYATSLIDLKDNEPLDAKSLVGSAPGKAEPKRGYQLQVGKTYGVQLELRRIIKPGSSKTQVPPRFAIINDAADLAASSRTIPFTGNYRKAPIWIRPRTHQPAPLDLWIDPIPSAGEPLDTQIGLRIPLTVQRTWPVLPTVLAVLFLVLGALGYVLAARTVPQTAPYGIAMALATLALSTGVAFLTTFVRKWEDQSGGP